MAAGQAIKGLALILGLSLAIAVCAQFGARPNGQLGLFGKRTKPAESPPEPAPALYIPGPPLATAPPNQTPSTQTPSAQTPAIQTPSTLLQTSGQAAAPGAPGGPEVLFLRAAQPPLPAPNPTLPPLTANPPTADPSDPLA